MHKILITASAGFLYWALRYLAMKMFALLNIPYSDWVGHLFFYVIPFLFGNILLVVLKATNYAHTLFGALTIVVSYVLLFLEVTIRQPAGPTAFDQTLFLFELTGLNQMMCAMIGGVFAVFLNRTGHKETAKDERSKQSGRPGIET